LDNNKANVTAEPAAQPIEAVTFAPYVQPTSESISDNKTIELVGIEATSEPPIIVAPDQNGRNMLLMLAFVVLLLAVFTLLDRVKMRRGTPSPSPVNDSSAESGKAPRNVRAINPTPTPAKGDASKHAEGVFTLAAADDPDIAVVIAAAVAMMTQAGSVDQPAAEPAPPPEALLVRRVRRKPSSATAWSRAGREEQVYSRMV
jgi:hypothetical protein